WRLGGGLTRSTIAGPFLAVCQANDLLALAGPVFGLHLVGLSDGARPKLDDAALGTGPVAFSRDGKLVAAGAKDNSLRAWDVASGKVKWVAELRTGPVTGVAVAGNHTVISAGARALDFWDAATG